MLGPTFTYQHMNSPRHSRREAKYSQPVSNMHPLPSKTLTPNALFVGYIDMQKIQKIKDYRHRNT